MDKSCALISPWLKPGVLRAPSINKILKKIAENSSEDAKVRIKMKELGFKWCSTGGPCEVYHKDIGDGKSMYVVVDDSGIDLPDKLDEGFMVTILESIVTGKQIGRAHV